MLRTLLAAAMVLACCTALAENNEGLYLGGGFGDFSVEIQDIDGVNDAIEDFDEDESASKYFVGWRFNRFLGVQADHYDLGNMTGTFKGQQVASDTDGFAASLVGTLPVLFLELYARAGLVFYDLDVDRGTTNVIDESDDDFVYGAGIGFVLLERVSLQLEYEVLDIDRFDKSDAWWLNASWRF